MTFVLGYESEKEPQKISPCYTDENNVVDYKILG